MKKPSKLFASLLIALLSLSNPIHAQFTKLMDFSGSASGTNPNGGLISDGSHLYGVTELGGAHDMGVLFKINPDGSGFTKLLEFDGINNGETPSYGSLYSDGTYLYGLTEYGGPTENGTIYKIRMDGTGYTLLYNFPVLTDGTNPEGKLISDGTYFYGMTGWEGANNSGSIFKIRPDGTGFTKLYDFPPFVNGRSLVTDGTYLYGVVQDFLDHDIFRIKTDGTGFTILRSQQNSFEPRFIAGSLYYDGTTLFGIKNWGGPNFGGSVFKLMPDGSGYTDIHLFSDSSNNYIYGSYDNSLTPVGAYLYGNTINGGVNKMGSIFKIMPDGSGFSKIHDFNGTTDGEATSGTLVQLGNSLYGMTKLGGTSNEGTLFKFQLDATTAADALSPADMPIQVYPNPTKDIIYFSSPCSIQLINSIGQIQMSRDNILSLDISNQAPGMYVISIRDTEGRQIQNSRLVKE